MIYANQAGTSWPKPPSVHHAMASALLAPPGDTELDRCAQAVAAMFGLLDTHRLQLTSGCTAAAALVFGDLAWREGDVVITSALEHHAVAREVTLLARRGVRPVMAPWTEDGGIDPGFVEERLRGGGVRMIACTMASNVTGQVLPVATLSRLAHEYGALSLVDVAQTAGVMSVDVSELGADLLVFAGHKGLLGPPGVGGLWAHPDVLMSSPAARCDGDVSSTQACEPFPSWCDAGSANYPAIAGLAAGIEWLQRSGCADVWDRLAALTDRLVRGVAEVSRVRVVGPSSASPRGTAVSLTAEGLKPAEWERRLQARGVVARAGLHCAPLAHEAIGTAVGGGTLRLSLGPLHDEEHVDMLIEAVGASIEDEP